MTWYADLSPCDCFGPGPLKAVGWLSRDEPFAAGEVSEEVFEKLCRLLRDPWNPAYPAGSHRCDLCRFTGGTGAGQFKEFTVSGTSSACLLVPAKGVAYVPPPPIAHYVDAHGYGPPGEFLQAVLECPPMRSVPYFKALLANGGRELVSSTCISGPTP